MADPAPASVPAWIAWLRAVWEIDDVAEALGHASPALARQVGILCAAQDPGVRATRRAVLSVARYLQRLVGRAMPFGFFGGVASASFGDDSCVRWGVQHRAVARAGAEWLVSVIARLEGCAELLGRLPVVANTTLMVRGDRLIVPYQPLVTGRGTGAAEVSLRYSAAVRAAVQWADAPIGFEDLSAKLQAKFPSAGTPRITTMLTELVRRGALITSLQAPSTEPDALGHLLDQLHEADASSVAPIADLVSGLVEIHDLLQKHNRSVQEARPGLRAAAAERMRGLAASEKHPLAVDLRLDASVALPREVAREIEDAAWALTLLSPFPVGSPTWRAYHQRFYERFGIGSLVPVLDVVSDSGIGWPDGYPGTVTPARPAALSDRDQLLLALAQNAAIDGRDEVTMDDELITALELGPDQRRPPPHLELGVRVNAVDEGALRQGAFTLEVVSVSRAAGVLTGRFLSVLASGDATALSTGLSNLPASDQDSVPSQLSFPPLDPATAHVTRTPQTLSTVISLAEHRLAGDTALTVDDLAVGCDGRRLYLADPARGRQLDASGLHALNLKTHTPPLARFLTELSRAQCAQVTTFDWGAAARLPFLPRLRYGRTILSPARWRLEAAGLPADSQRWEVWDEALSAWRAGRRLPRRVHLSEGDRLLPLDMDEPGHRVLLRAHLRTTPHALLTEAPTPESTGWCDGRAHEIIVPVVADTIPRWPRLPRPSRERIVGRHDQSQTPGTSPVVLASLYGAVHRQDVILAEHLPDLLSRFEAPPDWWFVRYRDPDHHLRLRIALPDRAAFGDVVRVVSAWADELRLQGLLREVTYPTSHPETGRWGSGPAWAAAQKVFGADSQALLIQLGLPKRPYRQALVAAHTVAIAVAFTGDVATGMRWLVDNVPAAAPTKVPRPVFSQAVRIADPSDEWAALRSVPGGAAIAEAWKPRHQAIEEYRAHLPGPHTRGILTDEVLRSLLHVNFVRACGIDFDDEAIGLHLARSAALSWTARTTGGCR
ncbi:lantibiotic dehydratase [Actinomadura violacea]|uniref:Lantibiotic dehydratase n=1 Tax=Actinomadura violacea TaxID=2819934 RepID=A0ABS3RUA6_9ACTN|nr:lantibiotic dehydratase [Actinomadura violacea]MBO2460349.1 lantibiotic dehydratase [Actinomadura violacea]